MNVAVILLESVEAILKKALEVVQIRTTGVCCRDPHSHYNSLLCSFFIHVITLHACDTHGKELMHLVSIKVVIKAVNKKNKNLPSAGCVVYIVYWHIMKDSP